MTDLTRPPSEPNATQLTPQISPGLSSLLNFEASSERAVSEIARTPALKAEAERLLPVLKATATEPAGEEGVYRVINRRRSLFPQTFRSEREAALWYLDYYETLAHLPEGALEAAMQAWVKLPEAEFMPKPGKLLELAKTTPNRAVRAYERAKGGVEYQPPREKVDPNYIDPKVREVLSPIMEKGRTEPSQADKERVRHQMREYIRLDDERKAKLKTSGPDLPPCHAQTDETGVSPQMRALIQGREDQ